MKLIYPSTEDEMILEFLGQEFASIERYGDTIKAAFESTNLSPVIITEGNVSDQTENDDRRRLFAEYRGYGRLGTSFFTDFPAGRADWSWMELTKEELLTTLFVRYWAGIWGSRHPRELAAKILIGNLPATAIDEGGPEPLLRRAEQIRDGLTLPPIIIVSADGGATRVVMEGNSRLTSYALAEDALPDSFVVMYGESPEIARWDEW